MCSCQYLSISLIIYSLERDSLAILRVSLAHLQIFLFLIFTGIVVHLGQLVPGQDDLSDVIGVQRVAQGAEEHSGGRDNMSIYCS